MIDGFPKLAVSCGAKQKLSELAEQEAELCEQEFCWPTHVSIITTIFIYSACIKSLEWDGLT